MQVTPVGFLGWEDPLEKGEATHSGILGLPWWPRPRKLEEPLNLAPNPLFLLTMRVEVA